jgi:hypothetical protein
VSHLPPGSTLEGTVSGRRVSFVKSYQGVSFGGYKVGDRLVGHRIESHHVEYTGTVSYDGRNVEGRWSIDANPAIGAHRTEGSFELHRVDPS